LLLKAKLLIHLNIRKFIIAKIINPCPIEPAASLHNAEGQTGQEVFHFVFTGGNT
jgi:hypothetical protein